MVPSPFVSAVREFFDGNPDKSRPVANTTDYEARPALTYDKGYFYPGPSVKNVPLSMAPKESQDIIKEFGRPEYADLISGNPIELPLPPEKMVAAFRRWDEEIGSKRSK